MRLGLRRAFVCPGSRSTPMVLALAREDRLDVCVVHDERAAAFMAVGAARVDETPAVVVTTSGTAAAELHPAVVEAHADRVPLIACTADRPPRLHGVGAPQTIDQQHLFGRAARAFFDPGVPADGVHPSIAVTAARIWAASVGPPAGPVHVNLPYEEPLVGVAEPTVGADSTADGDPKVRRARPRIDPAWLAGLVAGRRGVIVAGGHVRRPEAVLAFADAVGWPVLADPRSGCRVPHRRVIAYFDALLRHSGPGEPPRPDVILRCGSLPTSPGLVRWLRSTRAVQVGLEADGVRYDPDRTLDMLVAGDWETAMVEAARSLELPASDEWQEEWSARDALAARVIDEMVDGTGRLSEPAVARMTVQRVPQGGLLYVSASNPVRDVEWYSAPRHDLRVLANRGANGIDGVVSSATGSALASGEAWLLIGDQAFLHDLSSLVTLARLRSRVRAVVTDNRGGGIFEMLPQAELLEREVFERFFVAPHDLDLGGIAAAFGITSPSCDDVCGLGEALEAAGSESGPVVVTAKADRRESAELRRAITAEVASRLQAEFS